MAFVFTSKDPDDGANPMPAITETQALAWRLVDASGAGLAGLSGSGGDGAAFTFRWVSG
jgi:hypothetical protein